MRKEKEMTKKIRMLISFSILLLLPNLGFADCIDLKRADSWYIQGAHTIIYYWGLSPLASIDVPYCKIEQNSDIRLLKNYVCDTDSILVDGNACSIMTIRSGSGSSF